MNTLSLAECTFRPRGGAAADFASHVLHPLDDHYGLSPLEAAAVAVDTHNAARCETSHCWTMRPVRPVRWVYDERMASAFCVAVRRPEKRIRRSYYQGASNSGGRFVLEGGLDWKAMPLSPKDMGLPRGQTCGVRVR